MKILPFLALTVFTLSACTSVVETIETSVPPADSATETHDSDVMMDDDMMMMETPPPLSAEEAKKYKNDLPLSERITLAEELAMHMPKDGLTQMKLLFSDLQLTETIKDEDSRNMMMMGPETWYYSEEADVTIAICSEAGSPIHVFQGENPSQTEVDEAIEMMHEMMEEMMDDDMMAMDSSPSSHETSNEEPQFITYTQSHNESLIGKVPVVLFFHADWCPTCRSIEADINETLSTFPKGTKILKVDFDKETKTKQDYGVVVQSTVVVLDANGEISSRLAAPTTSDIIDAIKKTL